MPAPNNDYFMRYCTILSVLIFVTITYDVLGQPKDNIQEYRPFRLLVIKPDTARIADSLFVWADSIKQKHIDRYYGSIEALESTREMSDTDARREIDLNINEAKLREKQVHNFKYYHTIAILTLFDISRLFNTNYSDGYIQRQIVLDGSVIDSQGTNSYDLEKLGKLYDVDYIVTFDDIRSGGRNGFGTIKYTMTLYWTKPNKVILKKEIEGNAPVDNYKSLQEIYFGGSDRKNRFHESGVHCDNYLECMLISAARFSTEELFKAINKNERK